MSHVKKKHDKKRVVNMWQYTAPAVWGPVKYNEDKFKLLYKLSLKELKRLAERNGIGGPMSKRSLAICIAEQKNIFYLSEVGQYHYNFLQYMAYKLGVIDKINLKFTTTQLRNLLTTYYTQINQKFDISTILKLDYVRKTMEQNMCSQRTLKYLHKNLLPYIDKKRIEIEQLNTKWVYAPDQQAKLPLFVKLEGLSKKLEDALNVYIDTIKKYCHQSNPCDDIPIELKEWLVTAQVPNARILCNVTVNGRTFDFKAGEDLINGTHIYKSVHKDNVLWLGVGDSFVVGKSGQSEQSGKPGKVPLKVPLEKPGQSERFENPGKPGKVPLKVPLEKPNEFGQFGQSEKPKESGKSERLERFERPEQLKQETEDLFPGHPNPKGLEKQRLKKKNVKGNWKFNVAKLLVGALAVAGGYNYMTSGQPVGPMYDQQIGPQQQQSSVQLQSMYNQPIGPNQPQQSIYNQPVGPVNFQPQVAGQQFYAMPAMTPEQRAQFLPNAENQVNATNFTDLNTVENLLTRIDQLDDYVLAKMNQTFFKNDSTTTVPFIVEMMVIEPQQTQHAPFPIELEKTVVNFQNVSIDVSRASEASMTPIDVYVRNELLSVTTLQTVYEPYNVILSYSLELFMCQDRITSCRDLWFATHTNFELFTTNLFFVGTSLENRELVTGQGSSLLQQNVNYLNVFNFVYENTNDTMNYLTTESNYNIYDQMVTIFQHVVPQQTVVQWVQTIEPTYQTSIVQKQYPIFIEFSKATYKVSAYPLVIFSTMKHLNSNELWYHHYLNDRLDQKICSMVYDNSNHSLNMVQLYKDLYEPRPQIIYISFRDELGPIIDQENFNQGYNIILSISKGGFQNIVNALTLYTPNTRKDIILLGAINSYLRITPLLKAYTREVIEIPQIYVIPSVEYAIENYDMIVNQPVSIPTTPILNLEYVSVIYNTYEMPATARLFTSNTSTTLWPENTLKQCLSKEFLQLTEPNKIEEFRQVTKEWIDQQRNFEDYDVDQDEMSSIVEQELVQPVHRRIIDPFKANLQSKEEGNLTFMNVPIDAKLPLVESLTPEQLKIRKQLLKFVELPKVDNSMLLSYSVEMFTCYDQITSCRNLWHLHNGNLDSYMSNLFVLSAALQQEVVRPVITPVRQIISDLDPIITFDFVFKKTWDTINYMTRHDEDDIVTIQAFVSKKLYTLFKTVLQDIDFILERIKNADKYFKASKNQHPDKVLQKMLDANIKVSESAPIIFDTMYQLNVPQIWTAHYNNSIQMNEFIKQFYNMTPAKPPKLEFKDELGRVYNSLDYKTGKNLSNLLKQKGFTYTIHVLAIAHYDQLKITPKETSQLILLSVINSQTYIEKYKPMEYTMDSPLTRVEFVYTGGFVNEITTDQGVEFYSQLLEDIPNIVYNYQPERDFIDELQDELKYVSLFYRVEEMYATSRVWLCRAENTFWSFTDLTKSLLNELSKMSEYLNPMPIIKFYQDIRMRKHQYDENVYYRYIRGEHFPT